MKAAISDAPIARTDDRRRRWPLGAIAGSMILHAGLLAAVLAGFAARSPPTEPEPLTVELVVENAGAGARAAGEGGGGRSVGEPGGGLPAGSEAGPVPVATETAALVNAPAPPAVVPAAPTRQPPRRPRQEAAKAPPSVATERPRQQRAREPARPSAASPASPASPPTTDEPMSVAASAAAPSSAAASDASAGVGDIVASLGPTAAGGSAGAGRSLGGGTRGGGTGLGEGGASRGPGYALGSAANPMPPYPPSARRRGIEGTVVLRVVVSADGRALSVEIARSSGSDSLDEAARDTIARWRFRPATRNGEAMTATASVPVQFTLLER